MLAHQDGDSMGRGTLSKLWGAVGTLRRLKGHRRDSRSLKRRRGDFVLFQCRVRGHWEEKTEMLSGCCVCLAVSWWLGASPGCLREGTASGVVPPLSSPPIKHGIQPSGCFQGNSEPKDQMSRKTPTPRLASKQRGMNLIRRQASLISVTTSPPSGDFGFMHMTAALTGHLGAQRVAGPGPGVRNGREHAPGEAP